MKFWISRPVVCVAGASNVSTLHFRIRLQVRPPEISAIGSLYYVLKCTLAWLPAIHTAGFPHATATHMSASQRLSFG